MSTILLKRSLNTAVPASLANGEFAYTANGDIGYIGSNGGILAIAGKRVPGVLTANQAVVTNSTNMIDKMLFGNSTVNASVNSLALTLANSTVTFSLTKPTAAQVSSGDYFPNSGGGWSQVSGGTTNPGGSNTQIQFDDSGSFGGDANFTWNKDGTLLVVGNSSVYYAVNSVNMSFNGDTSLFRASAGVLQTPGSMLVAGHVQLLDDNWEIHADGTNGMIMSVFNGNDRGFRFRNSASDYYLMSIDTNTNTAFMNCDSGAFFWGNSTVNATMSRTGLALNGTKVVVNNTIVAIGANVSFDTVKGSYGNSTVNATVNSLGIALNGSQVVVNNSIIQNGANVFLDTVRASFGNSTVNATVNSLGISINGGAASLTATTMTAGLLGGSQINTTANLSFTGANVSMPNANLAVKDLNVSGNLVVSGTVTTVDATNLQVKDSMIKLADQNASDTIDIGFYGLYNDGTNNRYTGLFRDASASGRYVLWANNLAEPTTTVDTSNTSFAIATLQSYLLSGNLVSNSTGVFIGANSTYAVQFVANSLTLTTALSGTSGGTGLASYASGDMLVANSTNGFSKLSVPATDGSMIQWTSAGGVAWNATIDCGTF